MLSKELIKELMDILKEDFNLRLTEKEVVEVGNVLVNYFDLLAKINFSTK
jgi:hypothetical protein